MTHIRLLALARGLGVPWISSDRIALAKRRLEVAGFQLSFGKNVFKDDVLTGPTLASKLVDLQEALEDSSVNAIMAVVGGYNSLEVLRAFSDLPEFCQKPIIGNSDLTTIVNGLYSKGNNLGFFGPMFFQFGEEIDVGVEYSLTSLRNGLEKLDEAYTIGSAAAWFDPQCNHKTSSNQYYENLGWQILSQGRATGPIIGGNLISFANLFGTEYCPSLKGRILILEDVFDIQMFYKFMISLQMQEGADHISAILIGRFLNASSIDCGLLKQAFHDLGVNKDIPILFGLDVGHTFPHLTIQIGRLVEVIAEDSNLSIKILSQCTNQQM